MGRNTELEALEGGMPCRFADWPNEQVPAVAAGTYTIWDRDQLVYAGMAGRSLTEASILAHQEDPTKITGLRSRLASHASGRRSGDQFCIYVADLLVLPKLEPQDIAAIASRERSLDCMTRDYVRAHLGYRFVVTSDGASARGLENELRRGALHAGKPYLNPA